MICEGLTTSSRLYLVLHRRVNQENHAAVSCPPANSLQQICPTTVDEVRFQSCALLTKLPQAQRVKHHRIALKEAFALKGALCTLFRFANGSPAKDFSLLRRQDTWVVL